MRHRRAGRQLSRTKEHRLAMMRNLVTSLLEHERLETTAAKAKELRQLAEQMITLAKKNDLHARRQALAVVRSKDVVFKLFSELRERYVERSGGYTRIIPKGLRLGDAAPISVIELLGRPEKIKRTKKAKAAAQ
ncbi:50S ribosomal protein L17 [Desulfobacca acetoxidans DSM 11109]|uniref:Large ribosomal subunit protein bL17 n=1 Tax=Desulfobacca acetoxidans (strain ATCC 700848 / DSM 11109 / ASRB2) TaxID=880072 RepID=F2NJB0_DESAR|nr:50S ribosomal protein L17 [Desulfobacca acetoxidans]AEB09282.1 50S ribosomal protein L17 [Desulfobacca acetoxidans DSM 11109]